MQKMREIIFATGNELKFEVARAAMEGLGFSLIQQKVDVPELQSEDVVEIASFSAKWVSARLGHPVVVTDAGYYIKALNGFPGPFIKFINQWLTSGDILNLMKDKKDRSVEVKECLAYCEPGGQPVCFSGSFKGTISLSPGKKGTTPINEIFIPDGFDNPESEIPWEKMLNFWKQDGTWRELASYLKNQRR